MIDNIRAMPQREIYDIYAIYLTHLIIAFSPVDIFCHQFGSSEQHPLEISILIIILHLYQNQFVLAVFGQNINAVIFIKFIRLVTFAFQQFLNDNTFTQ